jgi:hypothetical protein
MKDKHEKDKQDLQNTTQKTKHRATETPLKTGVNSGATEGWACSSVFVTMETQAFRGLWLRCLI